MNQKTKRILSLLLALCISVSLAVMPAFAEQEPVKYVAFGESCTNGYGFNDYYNMEDGNVGKNNYGFLSQVDKIYPNLLRDRLGLDTSVLAFSGMRMDDLYAVLQPEKYVNSYYKGGDYYISNWVIDPDDPTSLLPGAYNRLCPDSGLSLSEYYNEQLKDADVITLALGITNMGTSITQRLYDFIGGNSKFTENIEPMRADINKDPLLRYYVAKIEADLIPGDIIGALATKLTSTDTVEALLNEVKTSLLYGFAGCCLYFKQIYNYIREVNPDAEIIVVGMSNLMKGLTFDIAGIIKYKIGDKYQEKLDMVAQYMKYIIKDDKNCYFADVGDMDTFVSELKACHGDPGTLSDDYYYRFVQNLILERVRKYPGVSDDVQNVSLVDLVSHFRDIGEKGEASDFYKDYGFFYQKFVDTLGAYSTAVQSDTLDAVDLIKNKDKLVAALEETSDYFGDGDILTLIAEHQNEGWAKALAYINARFLLAEGVTVHPNAAGHEQIYNAIVKTGACLGRHDWCSLPQWTWSDDGTEAVMTLTCKNNSLHKLEIPAGISTKGGPGCTEICTATATYDGKTYESAPKLIQLKHEYDQETGVCAKCGGIAPCVGLETVELTDGSHVLAICGKAVGSFEFENTDAGWTIKNADGKFAALEGGKLVYSDSEFGWTYKNSVFSATDVSNSFFGKLIGRLSGRNADKTYYLGASDGKLCASAVPVCASVAESFIGEHSFGAWHYDGETGLWTRSCMVCGHSEFAEKPTHDSFGLLSAIFAGIMTPAWRIASLLGR